MGCSGQWFLSTSSSPVLAGHPLAMYSHTNLLCHSTVFLLVWSSRGRSPSTIPASLSSLVYHPTAVPEYFFCQIFCRAVSYFFSKNLVADYASVTLSIVSSSFLSQKPRVFYCHLPIIVPCLGSIEQIGKDTWN